MTDHVTTITGHFRPEDFEQDENRNWIANYTISNGHLQSLTGLKPQELFSQTDGITEIKDMRSWGLGPHALQIGTKHTGQEFKPFLSEGHTAAAIGKNGNLLVGQTTGDVEGMTPGKSFTLDTSSTHLQPEAVDAMCRYKDVDGSHIDEQSFDTHKVVNVQGQNFALVPQDNFVAGIIDRNKSNKSFFDGFYSKGSHVVGEGDHILVPEGHYNQIATPLSQALYTRGSGLHIKVKAGQKPSTEGVGFTFGLVHKKPTPIGGVVTEVPAEDALPDTTQGEITEALARLGIKGDVVAVENPAV